MAADRRGVAAAAAPAAACCRRRSTCSTGPVRSARCSRSPAFGGRGLGRRRLVLAADRLDGWARRVAALSCSLNPNLLYLHGTPMTEPLLLAVASSRCSGCTSGCPNGGDPTAPAPRQAGMGAVRGGVDAIRGVAGHRRAAACVRLRAACGAGERRAGRSPGAPARARRVAGRRGASLFMLNSRITVGVVVRHRRVLRARPAVRRQSAGAASSASGGARIS